MRSLARGRRCARSGPPAVQHAPARSAPLGFAARRKKRVTGPAAAGPSPPCPLACEGAGISLGPRLASTNHQRSHNSHVPPRLRPGGRAPWASERQTPTRSGPRAQRHDIARRAHPHPRGRRPRANSARGRGRREGCRDRVGHRRDRVTARSAMRTCRVQRAPMGEPPEQCPTTLPLFSF